MKKRISLLLVVCLISTVAIAFAPCDLVKAGDITGTKEGAELMLKLCMDYRLFDKEYDLESFKPEGKVTYGEFAQWLYYSMNLSETKYPSKKKAMEWLRKIYYELALQFPSYAYQLLEGYTDGKFEKFSEKKQASWQWIRTTVYVLMIYQKKAYGQAVLDKFGFNFDTTVVDLALLGKDEKGNIVSLQDYYHGRWIRSYAKKKATKPIRIEALELLHDMIMMDILRESY